LLSRRESSVHRTTDLSSGPGSATGELPSEHPGLAQTLLGKRHRDSEDSQLTGVIEAGKEGDLSEKELAQRAIRPTRKRVKLGPKEDGPSRPSSHRSSPAQEGEIGNPSEDEGEANAAEAAPGAPAFTIFSGPEEPPDSYIDPPPPTTHLSELLGLPPANNGGPMTSTALAHENTQHATPFNFTFTNSVFQPITSTPAGPHGLVLPNFSYPEPPTSPTPGSNTGPTGGYIERAGGRRERNDLFHPHGAPRRPRSSVGGAGARTPSRASRPPPGSNSSAGEATINPALLRTPPLAPVPEADPMQADADDPMVISSNDVGQILGMASSVPLPPDTPAMPMKRTMYGTELEGDTRFGDFGVEGVATGFWTGTAPRF